MRVIHFQQMSGTGHVLARCGAWGSTDTDWTGEASGVTCVACREAMRDGVGDGPRAAEVPRVGALARRPAPRPSFALRDLGIALLAWLGAWALPAASGLLPATGSRATELALAIIVAILLLTGVAFAALAAKALVHAMRRPRAVARPT